MNSNNDIIANDDQSISIDHDIYDGDYNQRSQNDIIHSSGSSISSNSTTTVNNGTRRLKDVPPCFVCGAEAHGYNFDQITCESCKAFFRRNALKSMERFRCRNNDTCVITAITRKRCKRCRLIKCFEVGMRKDWILSDEEKNIKREKIVINRLRKQQAQIVLQQQTNDLIHSNLKTRTKTTTVQQSPILTYALMYMYQPSDQKMYDRQQFLLGKLSDGYQLICQQYPQPNKFLYRNTIISQTETFDYKLSLIQDLTRELTQMTTLRLLNFFNLIPEFQSLAQQQKTSILIQNMLSIFMFHGALTYDPNNDTFVDRTTGDEPYDAKYLLYVYGARVYNDFTAIARQLLDVTYQLVNDKRADEHGHTLFLLLMAILLFSDGIQMNSDENNQTKLSKIQGNYIDITCRYLHDNFGYTIGQRMFRKLIPLLSDLQKLCSTLANVNLCEMAEDSNKSSSSGTTTTNNSNSNYNQGPVQSSSISSSTEFSSTIISGRSHLNELQKENRAPSSFNSTSLVLSNQSSPFILSNSTTTTLPNYPV
ncbi:unnamed protein product [Adineta steineri]|uniref:Uncharacterized protein n=1 Tax=Adineta steineri TaxID=433720 RepID=A0A814XI67_9BILA|nr:unnamed protein product [Adineta steineri]